MDDAVRIHPENSAPLGVSVGTCCIHAKNGHFDLSGTHSLANEMCAECWGINRVVLA